jgi:sulfur carrier protein
MNVILNDKPLTLNEGSSLNTLLKNEDVELQFCAVAINNQIIPRSQWSSVVMKDQDVISVFNAIAGG